MSAVETGGKASSDVIGRPRGSTDSSHLLGPLWLFWNPSWAVWEQSVLSPPTTGFVQRRQGNCIHGDQTGSACLSCSLIMYADSFLPPTPNNRGNVCIRPCQDHICKRKAVRKVEGISLSLFSPPLLHALLFETGIFHWRQQATNWICPTFLFYRCMH